MSWEWAVKNGKLENRILKIVTIKIQLIYCKAHEKIFTLLLDNGVNVNLKNQHGQTALHLATINGEPVKYTCIV